MSSKPNGIVIYNGPSQINGEDIVAIATGFKRSKNRKTGALIQTWIMTADDTPFDAVEAGTDDAVCGHCKHRHFRSCYVNLAHGPAHVWNAWRAGSYTEATPSSLIHFKDRFVRFGSYGDPAAVPVSIWNTLLSVASGHTAYTHHWKHCGAAYKHFCMASCDTEQEVADSLERGWRPFYARQDGEALPDGFFECPASEAGGMKVTCVECGICNGGISSRKKNPSIIIHGPTWKKSYYKRGIRRYRNKQKYVGVN